MFATDQQAAALPDLSFWSDTAKYPAKEPSRQVSSNQQIFVETFRFVNWLNLEREEPH